MTLVHSSRSGGSARGSSLSGNPGVSNKTSAAVAGCGPWRIAMFRPTTAPTAVSSVASGSGLFLNSLVSSTMSNVLGGSIASWKWPDASIGSCSQR